MTGGGVTNWSFLEEDLIDELSLVIAPVADGSTQAVSIFERGDFFSKNVPKAFQLKEAKVLDRNTLWLRYDSIH